MGKKAKNYETPIDMTPMIDCVFQLMIFFIVTFKLDADMIDEKIVLAKAPNGPAIEEKMPGTVIVEVDRKGFFKIGGAVMNDETLYRIIKQAANRIGSNNMQILLRADSNARHVYVKRALDACTRAGVWRIQFAALKQKGS
jgi:biopolymer transport protein ExbD